MAATPASTTEAPSLSELSDEQLTAMAAQHPPLEQMTDEQLAGVATRQGYLSEDEAVQAVQEKKQRDRAPEVEASLPQLPTMEEMRNVPYQDLQNQFASRELTRAMLTKGGKAGDVAAEVISPIVGSMAGSVLPGTGTVVGGAAGGVAGEALAQRRQYYRGERDTASPGALVASAITGGVPLGGRLLATPARVIATRAVQGGAIATTAEAVRQLVDEHQLNFKGLVTSGLLGSVFGAGVGGVESIATRRAVLNSIRKTPEFKDFEGTDAELVSAVRARMAKEQPAAAEPKNVTPVAEKPAAPGAAAPEGTPAAKPLEQWTDKELLDAVNANPPSAEVPPTKPIEIPGRPSLATATYDDIAKWSDEATDFDKNIDVRVFGDRAEEYRKVSRQANSSNPDVADRGIARQNEMESGLSQEQQNLLYGVNLPEGYHDADAVKEVMKSVNLIDATKSVDELVTQNSRLIQKAIKASAGREPLGSTDSELTARLMKRANKLGATPEELVAKTLAYRSKYEGHDVFELAGVTPEQAANFLSKQKGETPLASKYSAQPNARGGRYISADVARNLVPGYDPANPNTANDREIHKQASAIADEAFKQGLADPKIDQVALLAGGAGSGKSSALEHLGDSALMYDGVFGSENSIQRIDQALAAGKKVNVVYVHRPIDQATTGVIGRRGEGTPLVRAETIARGHALSKQHFLEAAKRYAGNPDVSFTAIDNSGPKGTAKIVDQAVPFLEKLTQEELPHEQLTQQIRNHPAVAGLNAAEKEHFLGARVAPDDGANGGVAQQVGHGESQVTEPRRASMATSAPRPSAGQARVNAANTSARAAFQQSANLPAAAAKLTKALPTANAAKWFRGVRSVIAPQTLDQGAMEMSHILRAGFGAEYAAGQRADEALGEYRREFDRTPVPRGWKFDPAQPLPRNYELMRRIDTGQLTGLTASEQAFASTMRALFDSAIDAVQDVSPHSMRDLLQNYFPRIWQEPEKNAGKINSLLAKRPLEGPKSFLKQRSLTYFTDGLQAGLVPVNDNPVDVTLQKLGEMARFVTARRAMADAKRAGLRKFKYVYEPMPEGWRAVDDPSSDVWKPPTVTVQEAFDAQLRAKTIEMLEALGISHERTTKMGGKRWGEAVENQGIKTKFGGPDFVFWHEAGHMLDWRYPELRTLTGAMDRGPKGDQMRALADLRAEGQNVSKAHQSYLRKTEEKIANMFDAYIRAPEKFKAVAPDVYKDFKGWLAQHPEVQVPLDAIKPSLTLGSASSEVFAGGPIKLGDWIMPEGAAQVVDNYLQPGLGRYGWFRGLRDVSGLANGAQLLGFFHGQFVMNDSFYSGLGMALYDALNGKPVRAAKELLQTPISPATSWWRGRQIQQAIRDPATATAASRQIAQMAIEANLRAGHGPGDAQFARQWIRAVRELRQAPSPGAAWDTLAKAPFAAIELVLAPIMSGLVPRMKLGIFARMAERALADNPGATLEELRGKLAESADATEDRLGQVTYDNLFQSRVLKDAMQLALRAYGWQLTKYRMIAGGAADWGRAARDAASGKKPNVTFRMSYLPAMVIGHVILGATLQYILTGKRPEKPMDYLFPETGLLDKLGRPVRVSLADFVKDIAADWRSFPNLNKMGAEWTHKLAPFWNIAAEMYQNRDFWGTEIFSPKQIGEPEIDHLLKNLGEGAAYLASNAKPFSLSAGQKLRDAGASPAVSYVAPMFGFVPAPRYAIETPMQNFLSDQAGRTQYTKTQEQTQQSQAARDISAALRDRKPLTPEQQKLMRTLTKGQLTTAAKKAYTDPDVWAVRALDLDRGMQAWDLANDKEREKISPTLRVKIMKAYATPGADQEKLKRYLILVNRTTAK